MVYMFHKHYRGFVNRASCSACGSRNGVLPSGVCIDCGSLNNINPASRLIIHNRKGFAKFRSRMLYCRRCRKITMHLVTLYGYMCMRCGVMFK